MFCPLGKKLKKSLWGLASTLLAPLPLYVRGLREVEETFNACIHRSKGYSRLYFEEIPEQIKIGQKKYLKCVQLRNQPFRFGKRNF